MKDFFKFASFFLVLILSACVGQKKETTTNYYFDSKSGNDTNTGTTPGKAFKSLYKISELSLKPGDSVLLKSGALFTDFLYISCKGAKGKPIVLGKYDGETRPFIKGDASNMQAVHIYNSEHFVIRDLEISNKGADTIAGLNGLLVELDNYGTGKDITIDNLYVHDVYGSLVREKKDGGHAILLQNYKDITQDSIASRFDGLLVENCLVKDCQRSGIIMWGNWERKRWFPSLNVVIRNNILDGVPGDGIVPVGCERPLVEYNIMKNCPPGLPPSEACDGIWPWSCDNAVVQYNIVSDHKSQVDGYGFDSDWNSTNSLFQYNVSFNNDGGFLLVCNSGGWPPDWSIGNIGTKVKYNISINDGLRNYIVRDNKYFSPVIHITGSVKNTTIEKNLFYVYNKPTSQVDKALLHMTNWGKESYPDSTFFRNNYIFVEEPNLAFKDTKSTHNFFENNLYIGALITPAQGFTKYYGSFDKAMWYDSTDENWNKLVDFVKYKTVLIKGKEIPVLDIIDFHK